MRLLHVSLFVKRKLTCQIHEFQLFLVEKAFKPGLILGGCSMSVRIWIYQASSLLKHKFDMKALCRMAKELLKHPSKLRIDTLVFMWQQFSSPHPKCSSNHAFHAKNCQAKQTKTANLQPMFYFVALRSFRYHKSVCLPLPLSAIDCCSCYSSRHMMSYFDEWEVYHSMSWAPPVLHKQQKNQP